MKFSKLALFTIAAMAMSISTSAQQTEAPSQPFAKFLGIYKIVGCCNREAPLRLEVVQNLDGQNVDFYIHNLALKKKFLVLTSKAEPFVGNTWTNVSVLLHSIAVGAEIPQGKISTQSVLTESGFKIIESQGHTSSAAAGNFLGSDFLDVTIDENSPAKPMTIHWKTIRLDKGNLGVYTESLRTLNFQLETPFTNI